MRHVKYNYKFNRLNMMNGQGPLESDDDGLEADILGESTGEDTIDLNVPLTATEVKTIRTAEEEARKLMDIEAGIPGKNNKNTEH